MNQTPKAGPLIAGRSLHFARGVAGDLKYMQRDIVGGILEIQYFIQENKMRGRPANFIS